MSATFNFLDPIQLENTVSRRPGVLMVLKRKSVSQKAWILSSLKQYQFTEKQVKQVEQAIINGDLRVTDILERRLSHHLWSFLTFKWGEIFAGGKRLSKENVLQIAAYSCKEQPFERTSSQNRNRLIKGVPLVMGKVLTSMALCMVFCLGLLSTIGVPYVLSLCIATVLSACNGTVCLLSRGKVMLDSAGFNPKKQKTHSTLEENLKPKSISSRGQKLFFGVVILLSCISAGVSGYAGIGGLLTFFGLSALAANPFVLAATIGLCVISAVSFYSFQAMGVRENYSKFKHLFAEHFQKPYGLLRCMLLGAVSTAFLTVYATLTWFTAASGVSKLFSAFGANNTSFLAYFLSGISTSTTMVINTFSQVYKVFNPLTYTDLREKFKTIYQLPDDKLTSTDKIKYRAKNVLKLAALIGDSLAYSVAGGIRSGIHVGETIGEKIGARLALTITMAIFAPVILVFVSVAFTWPTVFDRKKTSKPGLVISEASSDKKSPSLMDSQNSRLFSCRDKSLKSNPKASPSQIGFFSPDLRDDNDPESEYLLPHKPILFSPI